MKALLTLDGSTISESILPTAQRLIELIPDLDLHLLMVLNPRTAHGTPSAPISSSEGSSAAGTMAIRVPPPRVVESHGETEERMRREAMDGMRALVKGWFAGIDPTIHIEWSREPAKAIVAVANSLDADVIVMATHGRSGISHVLAGSVAEAVIRSSGRPVLVQCPADQS